jgi:hypothetical protein
MSVLPLNIEVSAIIVAVGFLLRSSSRTIVANRIARALRAGTIVAFMLLVLDVPAVLGHDYGVTIANRGHETWLQLATGVNKSDDELIHVHHPNSRYTGEVAGDLVQWGIPSPTRYIVDVVYDHNGFRNSEDYRQADVVAIGDSFIEGAETAESATMVAQMGRQLGVVAANLGQSNYGPQQELIVLKRYGLPLSPKVVVWFFFGGNDLNDIDSYELHRQNRYPTHLLKSRSFTRNALHALARMTTLPRSSVSPYARHRSVTFTNSRWEEAVTPEKCLTGVARVGLEVNVSRARRVNLVVMFAAKWGQHR